MNNQQILQKIQSLAAERDQIAQTYQDQINVLLKAANQLVAAYNDHIKTWQERLVDESREPGPERPTED